MCNIYLRDHPEVGKMSRLYRLATVNTALTAGMQEIVIGRPLVSNPMISTFSAS